ncbi:MAG: 23S rRNA (adenine(2030)-N(6))-methyltransferase RlmJ [Neomegalonema sp.]|nr:23S rRNA (adenine(2030)-N(6))-methyltransferase RlmJ [Neomegalonema sp.]
MNYRHAFHAGNHADLLKHALFDAALGQLTQKAKPLVVVDAFAGSGLYDLRLDERADRTGEWRGGVARLWEHRIDELAGPLGPFLQRLQSWNPIDAEFRWYPGSPLLALAGMRRDDKLLAVEKHPEEHERLAQRLAEDPRGRVYQEDGWTALTSFLPPTPRRGIVLIDPPFEVPNEFERLTKALASGLRRWATGVFALWYPIKAGFDLGAWEASLTNAVGEAPLLNMALNVAPSGEAGLVGSGLAVANPPFGFDQDAAAIGAHLETLLAQPGAAGFRLARLRERL